MARASFRFTKRVSLPQIKLEVPARKKKRRAEPPPDFAWQPDSGIALGQRLMLVRRKRRLTQAKVAAIFGTKRKTISAWESGPRETSGEVYGWNIPEWIQPLIERWIVTGQVPTKDELNTAREAAKPEPFVLPTAQAAPIDDGQPDARTVTMGTGTTTSESTLKNTVGIDSSKRPLSVAFVISEFIRLRARTYQGDDRNERWKWLLEFGKEFGTKHVTDCKPLDILNWVAEHPTWRSSNTRRTRIARVLTCFNWAVGVGLIETNPFRRAGPNPYVELMQPDEDEGFHPVSDEDFAKLLNGCRNRRLARMLVFLRESGCRPKEMLTMTRLEIDRPNRIIQKRQHKTVKKTKKPRKIYVTDKMAAILDEISAEDSACGTYDPSGFVFRTARGKPWTKRAFNSEVNRAAKRAKLIGVVPYGIGRVAFIHRGILNGVNHKALAELVGHTTTTMIDTVYSRRLGDYSPQLTAIANQVAASPLPHVAGREVL